MAASSDNILIASIDPFLIRHSFSDYFWPTLSENDSLSKSIYDDHDFNNLLLPQQQQSESDHNKYLNHQQQSDLEQKQYKPTTTHPLTPSSDLEASATPNRRTTTPSVNAVNGKTRVTKRKSRATKKNLTTFITADPANFRQMVQQVTGIRFDSTASTSILPTSLSPFLKPEIHRPIGRYTSSFFSDQRQSLISDRSIYGGGGLNSVGIAAQSGKGIDSGYGASSDGFACFPTLESWKVM